MKKMATGILLCLFVAIVYGQEPDLNLVVRKKSVKCGNTITIFNSIKSIFDEKITWSSQNELMDNVTTVALLVASPEATPYPRNTVTLPLLMIRY